MPRSVKVETEDLAGPSSGPAPRPCTGSPSWASCCLEAVWPSCLLGLGRGRLERAAGGRGCCSVHGQPAVWLSLAVCRTEAVRRPFPGRKWTDTGLLWTLCNLRRLLRFHPAPLWAGVGLPVSLVFSPSLPTLPHSGVLCAVL